MIPGALVSPRGHRTSVSPKSAACLSYPPELAPGPVRGMDLLSPFWNVRDLTPEGRADFMAKRTERHPPFWVSRALAPGVSWLWGARGGGGPRMLCSLSAHGNLLTSWAAITALGLVV